MASADALAGFLERLGYSTVKRAKLSVEAAGIADSEKTFAHLELLSEDPEGFLRVVFAKVRSITAKARNDLVRALGRFSQDHLVIMASDFQDLEFVLIDKVKRHQHGPSFVAAYKPVPKVYSIQRKSPTALNLRILRRLTFTQRDALDQFDKLRSVFEAAAYTGEYYQNRALFADHYLNTRLREPESLVWAESPNAAFAAVRAIMADARQRFSGKDESTTRSGLIEPIFDALGFKHASAKDSKDASPAPDYILQNGQGKPITAALVYQWDRWLDGPDPADQQTPEENPGASVVSILERGDAEWVIVTNGRLWRLYSRRAHSRSTNFYEVDLAEALVETGQTDPGEAFRYWWLFFRPQAFMPPQIAQAESKCWLDTVVAGSREYAKQVEQRLKKRVFEHIVPHLATGFLVDRKGRLALAKPPSEAELEEIREGCLTLLYRLLFLLYAESRDLLPVRESPYHAASLKKIKQEIADAAGVAEDAVDDKLAGTYKKDHAKLYDRLAELFVAMDAGDPALNVPTYNGGLFLVKPDKEDDSREARIARFLAGHKVPDLFLAQAIDHLSRDPDEMTCGMVFIDYKSLGVRQLGSIYEGLLEFKLKIAAEDLTTIKEKGSEKVIPLSAAKGRRRAETAVRKGEPYLANDKSERRASGSYYTPDHIVEYIVENTVGPVLAAKLEALRPLLRAAEKTYQRHMGNLRASPGRLGGKWTNKAEFELAAKASAAAETYKDHRDLVERIFDCRVLDPAMGSGHFLVEAVDFITDKLLDFLNSFPNNPVAMALESTRRSILESLGDQGVSVDPDKLTDVHLLKRHVLKRCIYGVDLNPMAVELAKVSLWLDAFTLGAPLSFLDHHLRCGNSLIGATFDDLEKATAGQLFAIPYEQMYRAIANVLTVARLADATAAEVHHSADAYAAARQELSGYQIILDILVARHFGQDFAMTLLQHGDRLDLRNAESLMAGIKGIDRKAVDGVETLAGERRFFHWELEFPEVFFGPREGAERQIEHKPADQAGFDAVVGNPPYDVLSEKETGEDLSGIKKYLQVQPMYAPSFRGKNNLYKLFVCRAMNLLPEGGQLGQITPMAILGDDQAAELRKMILANGAFRAIDAFPQKDDHRRRVFEEAKLSTAVFAIIRTADFNAKKKPFVARVHPAQFIREDSPSLRLTSDQIPLYDPENLTIASCSQEDWDLAVRIIASGRMGRLRQVAEFFQGEINETNETAKGTIKPEPTIGPKVLRASAVCLYAVREPSQNTTGDLYVDVRAFLRGKAETGKAFSHREARVGVQGNAPQNNFRRLIGAAIPAGTFCFYTINFAPESTVKVPLECLLALLNSRMADWYFRLGSTSAHANQYQLHNLPCPAFRDTPNADDGRALSDAMTALDAKDLDSVLAALRPLTAKPPYGTAVRDVIVEVVKRIIAIEEQRGEIARTERSSLSPDAQPYQDFLDRLFYEIAGLSEPEWRRLEERLGTML